MIKALAASAPNFFCPCCLIIQLLIKKFEAALPRIDGTQCMASKTSWTVSILAASRALISQAGTWTLSLKWGCPMDTCPWWGLSLLKATVEVLAIGLYWELNLLSPSRLWVLGLRYIRCSEVLHEIFIQTNRRTACLAPGSLWEAGFLGSLRTTARLNWMKDEWLWGWVQSVEEMKWQETRFAYSWPQS